MKESWLKMKEKIRRIKATLNRIIETGIKDLAVKVKMDKKGIDIKEIKNMHLRTYTKEGQDNKKKVQDTILYFRTNDKVLESFGYDDIQYEINIRKNKLEISVFDTSNWTNIPKEDLQRITKTAELVEAVYDYAREKAEHVDKNKIAELHDELYTKYGLETNENEGDNRIFIGNRWHIVSIDSSDLYENRTEITDYTVEKTSDKMTKKSMDEINVIIENINKALKKINAD